MLKSLKLRRKKIVYPFYHSSSPTFDQGFQTRTRSGGQTVKTGNRNENQFFKHKELDFLLIP